MSVGRLLILACAAFLAGALGAAGTAALMGLALPQPIPDTAYGFLLLVGFFGPALAVAFTLGRRWSPQSPMVVRAIEAPNAQRVEHADELDALRVELAREHADERSGQIAAVLLVIFVLQGLSEGSVRSLAILVGVLLFHEGGHALGMLAFGYRDVRVFFLPFFGAAVTGHKADASAWQRAVVLLLGPVPGVMLGVAFLIASRGNGIMGEIGRMAVYINVFNLLPFEPLDGGRVLGVTLFSRSRWLEAAFDALGAVAILALGLRMSAWPLALLAGLTLLALPRRLRVAAAARRIMGRGLLVGPRVETLTPEALTALDAEACALAPEIARRLPARAALVREMHARIHVSPPGALVTLALLAAYGGGSLISLVALVLAVRWSPAAKARADRPAPAEVRPTRP